MARTSKLQRFARQIAADLTRGRKPALTEDMTAYLEEHFDGLSELLRGFVEHSRGEGRQAEAMATAYLMLLGTQLEYLRYRVDRHYDWASAASESFQQEVVALARQGTLTGTALGAVASELREARLAPSPELIAVTEELLEAAGAANGAPPTDIDGLLAQIVEHHGDDPFTIARSFADITYTVPSDFRGFMVAQMARSSLPVIRNTAALMVLDPDAEVRRTATESLAAHADAIAPTALRRLIAVRTWLLEAERPRLDQVVRAARTKGVECASWEPAPATLTVYASLIDGSGAQGFLIVTPAGRRQRLTSVLIKHGVGILDAWAGEPDTKRRITDTLDQAGAQNPLLTVSLDFLDRSVCHNLALTLENGTPPPLGLLQVAETLGATEWRPHRLDWRQALGGLVAAVPADMLQPDKVEEVLKDSAGAATVGGMSQSWFEDGPEVDTLVGRSRARRTDKRADRILADILEPRRLKWAERFTWVALWLKEGPEDLELPWREFAIVADQLSRGRPLKDISLMSDIALRTVMAA